MKETERYRYFSVQPKMAFYFVLFITVVGLMAPFIANDNPLIAYDNNNHNVILPIFNHHINQEDFTPILKPLIPYGEHNIDLRNANAVGPFEQQNIKSSYYRHWLGTDELGRDVLSQLIYGCKTAIFTALLSMLFAAIIGLSIGGVSAYFGDNKLRASILRICCTSLLLLSLLSTIAVVMPWGIKTVGTIKMWLIELVILVSFIAISFVLHLLISYIEKSFKLKKYPLAIDLFIRRLIEIFESLPLFFIIIAISALFKPSFLGLVFIISFSSWPRIAKYFRAEVFVVKDLAYIESGHALGFSNFRILVKHILPNAISSVLVVLSFGVASAILIEATLSFLGFGLSADQASWGKLLAGARIDYKAWWLAIFPGLAIFFTVMIFNQLGDKFGRLKKS